MPAKAKVSKKDNAAKGAKGAAKKATKKKDPNAPKRALSAYMFFTTDKREEVKKNHPGIAFTDIAREISKLWAALSEANKKKYNDLAKKDKERYEKEKASYEAKK